MRDQYLDDIEKTVLIVQLNGNCHQVLLSLEDKKLLLLFAQQLTGGLKLSSELMPIEFAEK